MQLSYRDLSKYLKILEYKTLSTMSQYANTTIEIVHIESRAHNTKKNNGLNNGFEVT